MPQIKKKENQTNIEKEFIGKKKVFVFKIPLDFKIVSFYNGKKKLIQKVYTCFISFFVSLTLANSSSMSIL